MDYKKATTFSKKFFKDINYASISNKFEPEVAKELSKYLLKAVKEKTPSIIYITR
jgi:SLT domain-containing protein